MNALLRRELETYFYNDTGLSDMPKVRKQTTEMLNMVRHITEDQRTYTKIENEILESCVYHELQGFLRGYDHCLFMTGRNMGGINE